MKKLLTLVSFVAILSSCGFNSNRQEKNTVSPAEEIAVADKSAIPVETMEDKAKGLLEEGKDLLKELAAAFAEEQAQQEIVESAASEEEDTPVPMPENDGKWYDRDFALLVIGHTYSMSGVQDKGSDVKWYLTRMGNAVYQHTVESSGTTVDTISEFTDDGKRNVRQYANGALRRSYIDEKAIHKYVYDWLTHEDHNVLGYHPDAEYAQSTGTFSGRRCNIIETEKEENLLGVKKSTVKQYYVDSEYDFLLKVCKSGSGAGMNLNNVVLWEVASFTDRPTEKDIYRK